MMSERVPLSHRPLRFVDCETLGILEEHPIIEFAIIDQQRRTIFDKKIKPPASFDVQRSDPKALEYSGYLDADGNVSEAWRIAPTLDEVAPDIIKALDGAQVWGHTTWFDINKLRYWFGIYKIDFPPRLGVPCFCIETLAAEHLSFLEHFSLTAIAEALGIDTSHAHTALPDARMVFDIRAILIQANREDRQLYESNYNRFFKKPKVEP